MYNELVQSLRLVGSQPEVQINALPTNANFAHEIAMIYGDACVNIAEISAEHKIGEETQKQITDLHDKLDRISDKKGQWTYKHLQTNPSWEGARNLAQGILKQLGEKLEKPNLDFVQWLD